MVVLIYFYFCFRNKLKKGYDLHPGPVGDQSRRRHSQPAGFCDQREHFAGIIVLITTHTLSGLTMPSIGVIATVAALATAKYPRSLLRQVDWKTIGFIIGLFLTVSGLEQTGVLDGLAIFLASLGGDSRR